MYLELDAFIQYILFCNSNVKYDETECQLLSNKLLSITYQSFSKSFSKGLEHILC